MTEPENTMSLMKIDKDDNGLSVLSVKSTLSLDNERIIPVPIPKDQDPGTFRKVVIAAYAQHIIEGEVTLDGVMRRSGLPAQACRAALTAPECAAALAYRGVNLNTSVGLTERQDLLLHILGDPFDGLNMQQKLKKSGVSNSEYQAWLKQPIFSQQFKAITEQLHNRSEEAMIQLQRKAGEGDLSSIKFLFEMNGRYNPATQKSLDITVIIARMLESLSRHVTDKATLAAVAADMRQIAAEANLPTLLEQQ